MRKSINNQRLSFKDLLFGRRQSTKALPEDFFETLIELELKINKDFSVQTFQKLISQYSMAIEFYKYKQDPHHIEEYQKRLNHLLSQSETLKKSKPNKEIDKCQDEQFGKSRNPANKKIVASIQKKNSNNTKINNQEKVDNIITLLSSKSSCDLLSQNLNEQEMSLKRRIQSRRQKKVINQNKSNADLLFKNKKLESLINMAHSIDDEKSHLGYQDFGYSFEGVNENIFEEPNSFSKTEDNANRLSISLSQDNSIQSPNDMTTFVKAHSKQKGMLGSLMDSINLFLDDFTSYFGNDVFDVLYSELFLLIKQRETEIFEVREKYGVQIMEMELINKDQTESIHSEGIRIVIQSLEQDRDYEIQTIEGEYFKKIKCLLEDFKGMNVTENQKVISLKNKLQKSITNTLSDVVCLIKENK